MRGVDGAVLGPASFVLRYFDDDGDDRILVVNLGERTPLAPAPEPLLAPPFGFRWETLWTSDSPRYGGPGAVQVTSEDHWLLPAEAAVALYPVRETGPRKKPKKR
jgi:maltooligosyltrehalose trehalohydrolase